MWAQIKKIDWWIATEDWWDEWIAWVGGFEYKCCDW